jgi:hypothetical protein
MKDLSYSTQSSRYARVRSSCLRLFVTKKIPDHEHFLRKIVNCNSGPADEATAANDWRWSVLIKWLTSENFFFRPGGAPYRKLEYPLRQRGQCNHGKRQAPHRRIAALARGALWHYQGKPKPRTLNPKP